MISELILGLVRLIIDAVGHDEAQRLVSEEAKRRANDAADAVAAARKAAGV